MSRNGPLALAFHALFVVFMLAPIVVVCLVAFTPEGYLSLPTSGFSLRWFRAIANYPEFVDAFWVSLGFGALSSYVALVFAVPAALAIARYRFRGRDALAALFLVAADDPACRARHRLPALLHADRDRRQFPGLVVAPCGGGVPVRAPPDAGRGDRHGPLGRAWPRSRSAPAAGRYSAA